MPSILVIDDDNSILESFKILFEDKFDIICASTGNEGINIIKKDIIDLVFLDYRLTDADGLDILQQIKKIDEDVIVIVITAYGTVETIIKATSLGAYDYIEKPLDADKIEIVTNRALESKKIKSYVKLIKTKNYENYNLKRLIGKSFKIQDIFKQIGRLINNDYTVLINGESGTGKELIAKSLHYNSFRKAEPFIAVNCSGLNETLLDNELFGHEPQAFTGAVSKQIGKFEAAGEGTIFLDEVSDMPLSIQSKFLRVLQEKEFHRLGGHKPIKLKARIIAASNKNLIKKIDDKTFRQDLYYRINVATLDIPPLRKRKEDISLLTEHFIKMNKINLKKNIQGISENALNKLINYNWPGNVRELENVITNICINLKHNFISSNDIPDYIFETKKDENIFEEFVDNFLEIYSENNNLKAILDENLEKVLLEKLGKKFNFNKTLMAEKLGISRITINKKLNS